MPRGVEWKPRTSEDTVANCPRVRRRKNEPAPGLEYPVALAQKLDRLVNMLDDVTQMHRVEAPSVEALLLERTQPNVKSPAEGDADCGWIDVDPQRTPADVPHPLQLLAVTTSDIQKPSAR
jgi:hypothetical protein